MLFMREAGGGCFGGSGGGGLAYADCTAQLKVLRVAVPVVTVVVLSSTEAIDSLRSETIVIKQLLTEIKKAEIRNNSVYVLKDETGTVQYVGRTNDVDKRRAAHQINPARAGLKMDVLASGLNLPEARALEQAGMMYYHTINTANKMNNQINSVSPKYWGLFKQLALGTLDYGWNQMSNEILYWAGS